jgi:hypothetical protein
VKAGLKRRQNMENTTILKSIAVTPFGKFNVAVDSTLHDAKYDIITILSRELKCSPCLVKVTDVKKSNRRITKSMSQIYEWAWINRI